MKKLMMFQEWGSPGSGNQVVLHTRSAAIIDSMGRRRIVPQLFELLKALEVSSVR